MAAGSHRPYTIAWPARGDRAEAIRKRSGFSMEADIFSRDGSKKRLRIIAAVETKNGIPLRLFGTKQLVA